MKGVGEQEGVGEGGCRGGSSAQPLHSPPEAEASSCTLSRFLSSRAAFQCRPNEGWNNEPLPAALLLPRAAVTGKGHRRSQPGHKPVIVCEGSGA